MAVFKCKICGGALTVGEEQSVITCEWCGTAQSLPRLNDERRTSLYDRANHLRRENNYDRAMAVYESILAEDTTDAEAYWSLVLCTYGVEYVKDPKTGKHVPTCNRAQYASILSDENYKSAIKYADAQQRALYEQDAQIICEIQKGYLAISQKEKPFDVFISYKETDADGKRTPDSVLAHELYFNLTNEGYKVFFSRITLEDKLGQEYEPYIFAALNSAKVMVVLGTSEENFNAVWVKNEWSRFLSIAKESNGKKVLIPAYRDMDPYHLPREFSHLQAQDMSKLGFMQDLVRGIKKIIGTEVKPAEASIALGNTQSVEPLLKRAHIFLEEGDYESAGTYAEKILDMDPENAHAYILKTLISFRLEREEALAEMNVSFEEDPGFVKALRYADAGYRAVLEGYLAAMRANVSEREKEAVYAKAVSIVRTQQETVQNYETCIEMFKGISGYKDSDTWVTELTKGLEAFRAKTAEKEKDATYSRAVDLIKSQKESEQNYITCIEAFTSISGYKDSDTWVAELNQKLADFRQREATRLEKERIEKAIKRAKTRKTLIRVGAISAVALTLAIIMVVLTVNCFIPMGKRDNAYELIEDGRYSEAMEILESLDGFDGVDTDIAVLRNLILLENNEDNSELIISDILEIGVPVRVVYQMQGGMFKSETILLAKDASADTEIVLYKAGNFTGLEIPTRTGYRFNGWSFDDSSYKPGDGGIVDIRLQANWILDGYVIDYDWNGGAPETENPLIYNTENESFTLVNPVRVGYTFIGWTGTGLDGLTMQVTVEKGSFGNRSYTANWQANKYTISFHAGEGVLNIPATDMVSYDEMYSMPVPKRIGYTFDGWYYNGIKFEDGVWKEASNVSLTAKWNINNYEIVYDLAGGDADNPAFYTINDEDFVLEEPTRVGYTFLGWTGTDLAYMTKTVKVIVESNHLIERTYTAHWEANTYTLTFSGNGGITPTPSMRVQYDTDIVLPIPIYKGYRFLGWYENDICVSDGKFTYTEDFALTAKWEVILYDVVYEMNGGDNHPDNPNSYHVEMAYTLAAPTKAGYTFVGWTWEESMAPVTTVSVAEGATGSRTYTAHWQANTYRVTYIGQGGTVGIDEQTIVYDATCTHPIPTRTGYNFLGWYTAATGGTVYSDGAWKTANDVILYAHWQVKEYTITYQDTSETVTVTLMNGINVVAKQTLKAGQTMDYIGATSGLNSNGSKVFMGWYVDKERTTLFDYGTEILKDLTLYARFAETGKASFTNGFSVRVTGTFDLAGQYQYRSFMPQADSTITITSDSRHGRAHMGGLFDADMNPLVIDNEDGLNVGFSVTYEVKARTIYYIGYKGFSSSSLNSDFTITLAGLKKPEFLVKMADDIYAEKEGAQVEKKVKYGAEMTLPTLRRDGYVFLGWYYGDTKVESGTWLLDEGDITLTARWEKTT